MSTVITILNGVAMLQLMISMVPFLITLGIKYDDP